MDGKAQHLELALRDAHQDDERRMHAQRFLERVVEFRNLAQRMETHLLAVGVELVELLLDLRVHLGVAQQLDQGPRRGARTGVVTREHQ